MGHFVMMARGKHLIEYFAEQQCLHLPQLGRHSEMRALVNMPPSDVVHSLR